MTKAVSEEKNNINTDYTVKVNSVAKALRILDCFTPYQPELSLTQISKQLNFPKSTLLNQIKTLESAGYLYKVRNSHNYRLGYKIMEISYCVHSTMPIVQYAIPVMEELQLATGEIIYLTTHINGRVLYLECLYPSKRSISYSVSGKTLPMHCTGCGKAMLSYMSQETLDNIIQKWGLPKITLNTYSDRESLMKELARSRDRGYALDNEEETLGVKCVATAIRSANGDVAGALSISGSVMSMTDDKNEPYAKMLANACNTLAQYAHLFPAIQLNGGMSPQL